MKSSIKTLRGSLFFAMLTGTALCAVSLAACSGTSEEESTTVAEESSPDPVEMVCDEYLFGLCEAKVRCCQSFAEAAGSESCATMRDRCLEQMQGSSSLRDGLIRINAEALRQFRESASSCSISASDFHDSIIVGTRAEGSSCALEDGDRLAADSCAPGLFCDQNDSDGWVCRARLAENEPCHLNIDCTDGFVCRRSDAVTTGGKEETALGEVEEIMLCLQPIPLGSPCELSPECGDGFCNDGQCAEATTESFYCEELF